MLAPGRLPGLFQDPRIIAAAVANATTALTKGLSAANQKFVFMLIISSIRRSTFQKIRDPVSFVFTLISEAFENRHFSKSEGSWAWLLGALPISLDAGNQGEWY
jgi:hypothetical protein